MDPSRDPRREVPSVDAVLRHPDVAALSGPLPREVVSRLAKRAVASVRAAAGTGLDDRPSLTAVAPGRAFATVTGEAPPAPEGEGRPGMGAEGPRANRSRWLGAAVAETLAAAAALGRVAPRRVINATGVVLHTNLGRAPLPESAVAALGAMAGGYADVELDLATGARGSRHAHLAGPILDAMEATHPGLDASTLDAFAVNNGAGAILLVLAELAGGREVVVSRGHLVEIGGGFRVPDVIRQGGARLVEVGTTNRTRLADYARAITPATAAILAVHPSNFRMVGFTERVPMADLAALGATHAIPVVDDVGSGCLLDTARFGLAGADREPRPSESLAAGAAVVTFSGDKLLGGPQAGLIVGRADLVARIRRHPLARALRLDKLGIVALGATLAHYRRGDAADSVPVWRMIGSSPDGLRARAADWARCLREAGVPCEPVSGASAIGGGSMPGVTLPTTVARIACGASADAVAARLRVAPPGAVPVAGRIEDGCILLDPRTVAPEDDGAVVAAVVAAVAGAVSGRASAR